LNKTRRLKMKIKTIFGLGSAIGVLGWGIGRIYNAIIPEGGIAATQFAIPKLPLVPLNINVQQQIIAGVDPSLAGKLLSVFGGGQIDIFMGLVMALIAGITVAFVGQFVVDALKGAKIPLPVGRKPVGQITAIMVYGTLISSVLVGFFDGGVSVPTIGFVIASVIYFLIIGWVYVGLRGLGLKQLPLPN